MQHDFLQEEVFPAALEVEFDVVDLEAEVAGGGSLEVEFGGQGLCGEDGEDAGLSDGPAPEAQDAPPPRQGGTRLAGGLDSVAR